jgi:hypothetical protein
MASFSGRTKPKPTSSSYKIQMEGRHERVAYKGLKKLLGLTLNVNGRR